MATGGISAQGSDLAINTGTALAPAWTKIKGVISFNGLDGSASDIDVTDLDSTAMEYINGLVDNGKFSMEAKTLHTDPGQMALRAALVSGARTSLQLTFPDEVVATFDILVKSMPVAGGVNAVLKGTIDTKVTGAVVWS
ncbi:MULTISPECIES: phage tail tube protein [Janthinobacterium]|uniref:phage tail tube protein n=1 Tax=Janthinobacterium TaxID=29580 RepID=UPI0025B05E9F|nr:phage tail tube protein [Janthinobacterium sp. SUN120]MDN2716102.1 phage tail tube protein [Janthinobacterium sp. SUN120]